MTFVWFIVALGLYLIPIIDDSDEEWTWPAKKSKRILKRISK